MTRAKPRLTLLSAEQINRIHEYSLEILATTGVRVDSPRARAVFERAIGRAADKTGCASRGRPSPGRSVSRRQG